MYKEAMVEFEVASDLMPSRREEILKNVKRIRVLMEDEDISDS